MTCAEARRILDAWFDRELDVRTSLEVEEHLGTCARCQTHVQNLQTLRGALRDPAIRRPLPPALERRIAPRRRAAWVAAAAVAAAAAAVAVTVFAFRSIPRRDPVDDFVAAHARSLLVNHLTDVASSDQHTVKPWFEGKLEYAPPVKDLAQEGFDLVGGRLEYLRDRPIAAIVYRKAQHVVNLFVWPKRGAQVNTTTRRGYTVVGWQQGDLRFCVISDLAQGDLERIAQLLRN